MNLISREKEIRPEFFQQYCKEKHSTYICMHYFCYQNKRGSHLCNETCKWNYFFRFDTTMFVFRPLDAVSLC